MNDQKPKVSGPLCWAGYLGGSFAWSLNNSFFLDIWYNRPQSKVRFWPRLLWTEQVLDSLDIQFWLISLESENVKAPLSAETVAWCLSVAKLWSTFGSHEGLSQLKTFLQLLSQPVSYLQLSGSFLLWSVTPEFLSLWFMKNKLLSSVRQLQLLRLSSPGSSCRFSAESTLFKLYRTFVCYQSSAALCQCGTPRPGHMFSWGKNAAWR